MTDGESLFASVDADERLAAELDALLANDGSVVELEGPEGS